MSRPRPAGASGVDLLWLPLGAGGRSVRLNGRVFEWFVARRDRRDRCDLYHSALEVRVPEGRYAIESAPSVRARAPCGTSPRSPLSAYFSASISRPP